MFLLCPVDEVDLLNPQFCLFTTCAAIARKSFEKTYFLLFILCSLLLDKKFKSELVRMDAEAAAKMNTRPNRYETLLKQRHVQVLSVHFS